jgi:hypothetical protein
VVALEVILPDSGRVEVTDTVRPTARAFNALGDSIAAQVFWSSFDAALTVLDSTTGESLADSVGTGRLQARVGGLRSDPQTVVILTHLDTLWAVTTRVTVIAPDTLSSPLEVQALASPDSASSRRVVYAATIFPASGPAVTFVPNDSVLTSTTGLASVQLKLLAGPVPDSVVITATMTRPNGTSIPGSPVTFVVEFVP